MSGSGRVLVVEDEESFVEALTVGLTREGFTVKVARDGKEALDFFSAFSPDIVLLDVMLPLVSGVDVCRQIRARSQVPIIMVTAKGEEIDAVVGLEVGADDYVTKPYRLREVGDVAVDPESHEVFVRGKQIELPLKEFDLLELLLTNAGRVLTRDALIDQVWGSDYVGDTKTLDVHVKRLRSKVEEDPSNPSRIVTIRGLGYKYATGVAAETTPP